MWAHGQRAYFGFGRVLFLARWQLGMGAAASASERKGKRPKIAPVSGFDLMHHKVALMAGKTAVSTEESSGGRWSEQHAAVKVSWDRKDSSTYTSKKLSGIFSGYGEVLSIRVSR